MRSNFLTFYHQTSSEHLFLYKVSSDLWLFVECLNHVPLTLFAIDSWHSSGGQPQGGGGRGWKASRSLPSWYCQTQAVTEKYSRTCNEQFWPKYICPFTACIMHIRVQWFLKTILATCHVVPNCCRTPIPKFHVFMLPLSLGGRPQKIKGVNYYPLWPFLGIKKKY